jgi:predicted metal-dependent HD superfamily phosphohydrolase
MDFTKAKDYITQRLVNDLSSDLSYHGAHHTFAVVKAAALLAAHEGISKHEYNLLLTAAYFHDSGFLFEYKSNEPFAVKLTEDVLPQFDYSEQEVNAVNKIILATQSHVLPKTLLEEIMCDADHDYIGTDEYHTIAKTLRKELITQGIKYNDLEWIKVQHTYLTSKHTYYTKTANKTRLPKKEEIIKELHLKISESIIG